MKNELVIDNIRYSYKKGNEIIHGVSAAFTKGKITALIGANGCGKSTLLNLIAGVMKPDSGKIMLNGKNIFKIKKNEVAKNIAVVHQSNTVPGDITVKNLVYAGRTPYKSMFHTYTENDKEAVNKAISDTNIGDFAERPVLELSGGQMQRVWLAMALAQETDILLLDEITTYLDIHYQIEILNLIKKLNKKKNITIIMVLHDINLALEFCDEIIIMKEGCVISKGKIDETVSADILNEAFEVHSKIISIDGKKHCIFKYGGYKKSYG